MSELYPAIKHLHMLFAMVSLFGFLVRSGLKFSGSALLDKKLVKILPHVNDTLLLVCGILLAVIGGFNPFTQLWLLAKILLLVAMQMVSYMQILVMEPSLALIIPSVQQHVVVLILMIRAHCQEQYKQ